MPVCGAFVPAVCVCMHGTLLIVRMHASSVLWDALHDDELRKEENKWSASFSLLLLSISFPFSLSLSVSLSPLNCGPCFVRPLSVAVMATLSCHHSYPPSSQPPALLLAWMNPTPSTSQCAPRMSARLTWEDRSQNQASRPSS